MYVNSWGYVFPNFSVRELQGTLPEMVRFDVHLKFTELVNVRCCTAATQASESEVFIN